MLALQANQAESLRVPAESANWQLAVLAGVLLLSLYFIVVVPWILTFLRRRRLKQTSSIPPGYPYPPGSDTPPDPGLGPALWSMAALVLIVGITLGFFLGAWVERTTVVPGGPSIPASGSLLRGVFFGVLTSILLGLFINESLREERPRIDTHWGGFGGGLGGWTISRSLVYLCGAVLFGALTALTSYPMSSVQQQSPTTPSSRQSQQSVGDKTASGAAGSGTTTSKDAPPEGTPGQSQTGK
jgi:hypothetical protein